MQTADRIVESAAGAKGATAGKDVRKEFPVVPIDHPADRPWAVAAAPVVIAAHSGRAWSGLPLHATSDAEVLS